jgi:hypothetical protein
VLRNHGRDCQAMQRALPVILVRRVGIKVKVKATLEQATTDQRGSRGIALLCP